ncbi:aminotransferase class I/II-fold pyridoxal phosphate-dependent enzyme [Bacillus subtilis]|nr:aminotransferase class I/II-fold pyridoxal phosphate-dependent enzyme [Bacillus subtilis]
MTRNTPFRAMAGSSQPRLVWSAEGSRERGCKRWNQFGQDIIDLTVAEMDTPLAEPIRAELAEAMERQSFGYPVADGDSEVPTIAAQWLTEQHGLSVESSNIRLVPELMRGIIGAITHLTRPDSAVVVPTPSYGRYFDAIRTVGRGVVEVPMVKGIHGYQLDLERIEQELSAGAGSVVLCHPGNPTGNVFTSKEMLSLAEVVDRHGARVISDEIHAPLRYQDEFTPYASLDDRTRKHGITLMSATKAWNFPGLRCGMAVLTNEDDVAIWSTLPRVAVGGISPLGMIATMAALRDGQSWLDAVRHDLADNRQLVGTILGAAAPELVRLPEASYLAWIDLRRLGVDDPSHLLRERIGVATSSGPDHGAAGRGFVRLNFATAQPVLTEALERIASLVKEH